MLKIVWEGYESVAQIDLREFQDDSLVIHLGGEARQIDALTFLKTPDLSRDC